MTNLNKARVLIIDDERAISESIYLALVESGIDKDRVFPNINNMKEFYTDFYESINSRDSFFNFIINYICINKINYLIIDLHLSERLDNTENYEETMGFKLIQDLISNNQHTRFSNKDNYPYFAIPKLIISNHCNLNKLKEKHGYFVTDVFSKITNVDQEGFMQFFKEKNILENINFSIDYFESIQSLLENDNKVIYDLLISMNQKMDQIILKVDDVVENIIKELELDNNTLSQKEIEEKIINFKLPFLLGEVNLDALYYKLDQKFMELGVYIQTRNLLNKF